MLRNNFSGLVDLAGLDWLDYLGPELAGAFDICHTAMVIIFFCAIRLSSSGFFDSIYRSLSKCINFSHRSWPCSQK